MYSFARRPKWIVSHVLVLIAVVAMIGLGLWQLRRLDQRQDSNGLITDRLSEPVARIDTLTSADDGYAVGDDLRFRLAMASGEYRYEDEVLVLNRTLNGLPGYWALTPLDLGDGTALVVNRGWIPFALAPGGPRPGTEPPGGEVSVEGLLRKTVVAEGLQNADPATGVLDALARPDLARLEQQLDYPILPVYLQLERQSPAGSELPIRLERPELGQGPHLSYAVQWFVFTAVAVVGYPLVLRKVARSEGGEGRHSDIPVDYLDGTL